MQRLKMALDELRGGGDGAEQFAEWLRYHFLYLVEEAASKYVDIYEGRYEYAEFTAPFFMGLSTAIDRLAQQQAGSRTEVEQIEAYISDEIERARRDYFREISSNILPPSSTNAMRKRNGQAPYQKIARVSEYEERGRDRRTGEYDAPLEEQPDNLNSTYSALRSDGNGTPYVLDEGGEYYIPSRMVQYFDFDTELFDILAPSPIEGDVLALLLNGYSERDIAAELGKKPSQIRAIREQIKDRAVRKGYSPIRSHTA